MPAPSTPATENEALTNALIAVMAAHIQNALGVFSLLSMGCLKGPQSSTELVSNYIHRLDRNLLSATNSGQIAHLKPAQSNPCATKPWKLPWPSPLRILFHLR